MEAALVMHASPSDVECVIVNGEVVREDRKLLKVEWEKLREELGENINSLEEKWKDVDWDRNTEELAQA